MSTNKKPLNGTNLDINERKNEIKINKWKNVNPYPDFLGK